MKKALVLVLALAMLLGCTAMAEGNLIGYTCMDGTVRVRTSGDGQYDVQSQKIREQTYYGEPAADGHYTVSRAAEQ